VRVSALLGRNLKQENVHIREYIDFLPENTKIGIEDKDGWTYEPYVRFEFKKQLSDKDFLNLAKIASENGMAGLTLASDRKSILAYNISKFKKYEDFREDIRSFELALNSRGVDFNVKGGIIRLLNIGREEGGATRTYEEILGDIREQSGNLAKIKEETKKIDLISPVTTPSLSPEIPPKAQLSLDTQMPLTEPLTTSSEVLEELPTANVPIEEVAILKKKPEIDLENSQRLSNGVVIPNDEISNYIDFDKLDKTPIEKLGLGLAKMMATPNAIFPIRDIVSGELADSFAQNDNIINAPDRIYNNDLTKEQKRLMETVNNLNDDKRVIFDFTCKAKFGKELAEEAILEINKAEKAIQILSFFQVLLS